MKDFRECFLFGIALTLLLPVHRTNLWQAGDEIQRWVYLKSSLQTKNDYGKSNNTTNTWNHPVISTCTQMR